LLSEKGYGNTVTNVLTKKTERENSTPLSRRKAPMQGVTEKGKGGIEEEDRRVGVPGGVGGGPRSPKKGG